MSLVDYAMSAPLRSVKSGWIFNLVKSTSKLTVRVLIPLEEFKQKYPKAQVTSSISNEDLLSETLVFEDVRCNFQEHQLHSFEKDDVTYVLLYESYVSLDEIKNAGSWVGGNVASIYMPIVGSVFEYRGMYSYLFSFNHHQDALTKLSTQALATRMRRLLMVECVAHFAVRDETADLMNTPVVLHLPSNVTVITNVEDAQSVANDFDVDSLLAQYSLTYPESIAPDQSITVNVNAALAGESYSVNTELLVAALSGYAPVQTISVVNGSGSFRVKALGLQAGEKLCFAIYEHGRLCAQAQVDVVEE